MIDREQILQKPFFFRPVYSAGKEQTCVDEEYIETSLKNGYSALRLFAYPSFKEVEPEVVSIIR